MNNSTQNYTLSVLVENKPGVLARIAGLFSGRGFNIASLTVAETDDPSISRMTIVTSGDAKILEQITKHLNRLIDVIKVVDLSEEKFVDRELALIKIKADAESKPEILRLVQIFRGNIVDVSPRTYTIEVTGDEEKILAFIELVRPLGIIEIARTGRIAMGRGNKGL